MRPISEFSGLWAGPMGLYHSFFHDPYFLTRLFKIKIKYKFEIQMIEWTLGKVCGFGE
jgi:hypothetical protein